jgi:HAD superfamily hydrolase (TIGR01509 family)
MNIIIPLGGKGERFAREGYTKPKALIPVFDKTMIECVIDNLNGLVENDDKIYIIYNKDLDAKDGEFSKCILDKYLQNMNINLIKLERDTLGAAETLYIGIDCILKNGLRANTRRKCVVLDCDTFYTEDILTMFRNENSSNAVFYTEKKNEQPIYSYIKLVQDDENHSNSNSNSNNTIVEIAEKVKISNNANTGCYAFQDIVVLKKFCKKILDEKVTFNGECYTSCVIAAMIKEGEPFIGLKLDPDAVFSLGTPKELKAYMERTHAFLFDLDGTLVKTDDIYFQVWIDILNKYNITLTPDIFKKYIQGNNDKYVTVALIPGVNVNLEELSSIKDTLFLKYIQKIKIIDGAAEIMYQIKKAGHKCCIVTNCNRTVAREIIKKANLEKCIDFIISNTDCKNSKPHPEPYLNAMKKYGGIDNSKCIIFEDSKTGILSAKSSNPKILVGIETIYDHSEIIKYGVDISIPNYSSQHFDINKLLESTSDGITIETLSRYIKNSLSLPLADQVSDIVFDKQKLKGGNIADVIALAIVLKNGLKKHCVFKLENKHITDLSTMAQQLQLYDREYYFYSAVAGVVNVEVPEFLCIVKDDDYDNCGILLENLYYRETQFALNLDLNEVDLNISLQIIENMTRYHSKFWSKPLRKMFPQLKMNVDKEFCPFFQDYIQRKWPTFKEKWQTVLPVEQMDKCERIVNDFTEIQKRLSEGNQTLVHGDVKSPNLFYDIKNNYEPIFLDWQHCIIGKGVQDFVFFVIESFHIGNLDLYYPIFKNYYYKKLLENGVKNYSFAEYEQDIRDAVCYIPLFTSIWFGTVPYDELIDKNFPFFFIQKFFYFINILH